MRRKEGEEEEEEFFIIQTVVPSEIHVTNISRKYQRTNRRFVGSLLGVSSGSKQRREVFTSVSPVSIWGQSYAGNNEKDDRLGNIEKDESLE